MYTIRFPAGKSFTGDYLSVTFKDGEGQTDSDYLAERFARKGLEVTQEPEAEQQEDSDASAEKEWKKAAAAAKKAAAQAAAQSAGDTDAQDSE